MYDVKSECDYSHEPALISFEFTCENDKVIASYYHSRTMVCDPMPSAFVKRKGLDGKVSLIDLTPYFPNKRITTIDLDTALVAAYDEFRYIEALGDN